MAIVLSENDVRQLLRMPELIVEMEEALRAYSCGAVQQPLRTVLQVGGMAFVGVMPAFRSDPAALGTKLVTVTPANAQRGLPTHLATILLLDPQTGELRAVLDGRLITEARTGAVSAASVRSLARADASVLAILGSGVQAHSHLEAIASVRRLADVRVWSPTPEHRARFARAHQGSSFTVRDVGSAREAVDGAHIIVTATPSPTPVLEGKWISSGAHVCAVGSARPNMRELDTDLIRRARVFVDSREAALAEAGDLVIPIQQGHWTAGQIAGELGEVLAGRVPGRSSADEITVFKSLGMAIEDVAAADLVCRRAAEVGLGRGLVL